MEQRNLFQARVRKRLDDIGLNAFEAARRGGFERNFLHEIVNGKKQSVQGSNLIRLARILDCEPDYLLGLQDAPKASAPVVPGLHEGETAPYVFDEGDVFDVAVKALMAGYPNRFPYRLTSRVLEEEGLRPLDILIADMSVRPQAGDIVCAQIYAATGLAAETVWRLYRPPYLLGATRDMSLWKPELVDGERVMVRGVMVAALRPGRNI